jgi:polysaccharide biosynthesis/export protein
MEGKNMKKAFALVALIGLAVCLSAQSPAAIAGATTDATAAKTEDHLQLAMSSIDYPVTPSDVYLLMYRQSTGETLSRTIQVTSDYIVDLGIFGKIDATKMTFADLKRRVEGLYAESYARSYPSLTIQSVGVFRVTVNGEISRVQLQTAWGLSRLSDIVQAAGSQNASLRNVLMKPRGVASAIRYDILKAWRLGDSDQDPLVRPSDVITLSPAGRTISLIGEVREPGRYEVVKNEGLRELIEQFGGGLTSNAELSRVRIDRISKTGPVSEYVTLPKAYEDRVDLTDCISVSVLSRLDSLPVVWFEGAVADSAAGSSGVGTQASAAAALSRGASEPQAGAAEGEGLRISIQISEGELLSDALREVRSSIQPMADLASASLFRQGSPKPIAVNLQPLLATPNPSSDIPLKPYDRIYIPALRSTVRVAGAVLSEGSFRYRPNSFAAYYIGLAGGADPLRNEKGFCIITDALGNLRSSDSEVQPGDQIFVLSNLVGITVSGAVTAPGVFPYQSRLSPSLYINQAGGIDPQRGTGSFFVTDQKGKRRSAEDLLLPGDRIYVRQNRLGYNIVQYLPVITGIVSLATSIYTLSQVLK